MVSPRILSYNRRRPSEEDLVPFPAQLERNLDRRGDVPSNVSDALVV